MEPTLIFTGAQARQIITSETEYSQPRNFDFRNAILGAVAPALALGMSLKEGRLAINSGDSRILPKLAHRILVEYDVFKHGNNKRNPSYGAVFSGAIPMASFSGAVALPPLVAIYEMLSEKQAQQNGGVTSECEVGIQAAVAKVCAGGEGTVLTMCPGNLTIGPNRVKDPYTNNTFTNLSFSGVGIPAGQSACDSYAPAIITNAIRRSGSQPVSTETSANGDQVAGGEEPEATPTRHPDTDPVCLLYGIDTAGPLEENLIKDKITLPVVEADTDLNSIGGDVHLVDTSTPETAIRDINKALWDAGTLHQITAEGYWRLAKDDAQYNFPNMGAPVILNEEAVYDLITFLRCAQGQIDEVQPNVRYFHDYTATHLPTPEPERSPIAERFVNTTGDFWEGFFDRIGDFIDRIKKIRLIK